jgi:hypothetical protein
MISRLSRLALRVRSRAFAPVLSRRNAGLRAAVRASCACLLLATAAAAPAQTTVYRCGPDGREYSASPCPAGTAVVVDDARSAAQVREAQEVARRESRLADRLAAERRRREAAAVPRGAARLDAPRAAAPAVSKAASKAASSKGQKKRRRAEPPEPPTFRAPAG